MVKLDKEFQQRSCFMDVMCFPICHRSVGLHCGNFGRYGHKLFSIVTKFQTMRVLMSMLSVEVVK